MHIDQKLTRKLFLLIITDFVEKVPSRRFYKTALAI